MSNLSEEEIIKEVENLIIVFADATTDRGYTYEEQISAEEQLKTIQGLLDLYNKEKENTKKLAGVIMFMGTNPDITEEECIKAFTENPITEEILDKFRKEYISKDKIREFIDNEIHKEISKKKYEFKSISAKRLLELLEE